MACPSMTPQAKNPSGHGSSENQYVRWSFGVKSVARNARRATWKNSLRTPGPLASSPLKATFKGWRNPHAWGFFSAPPLAASELPPSAAARANTPTTSLTRACGSRSTSSWIGCRCPCVRCPSIWDQRSASKQWRRNEIGSTLLWAMRDLKASEVKKHSAFKMSITVDDPWCLSHLSHSTAGLHLLMPSSTNSSHAILGPRISAPSTTGPRRRELQAYRNCSSASECQKLRSS
mmetsp:Transcript_41618/g.114744  ORF Transcript_41618/g.114744 Transcript_41618/m.114744 type:complete len:233 (-) Transcript_41618:954-1652(-)